jgi:hypothetical protein
MAPKDDEDEPTQRLASCLLRHRWTDKLYLVLGIEEDEGMQLLHTHTPHIYSTFGARSLLFYCCWLAELG